MGKWHVIKAVFHRNFISYFSNPVGYLFMAAFVVACSYFAFCHNNQFFANNIADLEQLNQYIPYLLLFFVPAITMSVWAEEKRSGTEELLLTLPATDREIVIGKYLSCLSVYTISLAFFALTSFIVLYYLHIGAPDVGLMVANFLGYWFMGAAFLATGMVASVLTANITVAFIFGALFCLILVLLQYTGVDRVSVIGDVNRNFMREISDFCRRLLEYTGIVKQYEPFGRGLISFPSLVYFASILVVMLYLNMVLLSLRHWSGSRDSGTRWFHYLTRAVCIVVAVASLTLLADRMVSFAPFLQTDATSERLHKLSNVTISTIRSIDDKRPVYVEAFLSKSVPRELEETKRNLMDTLRQYASYGGSRVQVAVHEIDLFSEQARQAERVYDIRGELVQTEEGGTIGQTQVFLGAAFKCGINQKSIPFFYKGMPIEYEITNMLRSVAKKDRRKIGILTTDAAFFGTFNMQTFQPGRDWQIVSDLKQPYDVVQISPDQPIKENIECLIVPMASSLTQPQLDNLITFVRNGNPTLIFDDPVSFFSNGQWSAREQKPRPQQNPMFGGGGPPPVPKGNVQQLWDLLHIEFNDSTTIGQFWNPLTKYKEFDEVPEFVFIGPGSGNPEAFNTKDPVTSGLQNLITLFPGSIRQKLGTGPKFTDLLNTSKNTCIRPWNDVYTPNMFGARSMNPEGMRIKKNAAYTIAARIEGEAAKIESPMRNLSMQDKAAPDKQAQPPKEATKDRVNVIVVADLDMISDTFYRLRRQADESLWFDNVTFVLNCVDSLVKDDSILELRKRRPLRRNLNRINEMTKDAANQSVAATEAANEEAKRELELAQKSLDDAVDQIKNDSKLDNVAKKQKIELLRSTKERELDVKKQEIDLRKKQKIRLGKEDLTTAINAEQRRIKWLVVLLPPIPIALIGLAVFFRRLAGEKEGVSENRLIRK